MKQQIEEWARSVAAAPLKPMQALEIWRDTILPRVKARILHSRPSSALLKSLDTQILNPSPPLKCSNFDVDLTFKISVQSFHWTHWQKMMHHQARYTCKSR